MKAIFASTRFCRKGQLAVKTDSWRGRLYAIVVFSFLFLAYPAGFADAQSQTSWWVHKLDSEYVVTTDRHIGGSIARWGPFATEQEAKEFAREVKELYGRTVMPGTEINLYA